MSNKYPGGLVTLNPPAQDPALGAATPGVWTIDQALNAEQTRSWAMYDPYYNQVVLNLHGNGTNAAQNNTFLDSSTNNFTITRNGNTTQGSFSPYGALWSNFFGSANFFSSSSNAAFAMGTGDFTVEAWVFPTSAYTTYNYIYCSAANNGLVLYVTGGQLVVRGFNDTDILASATIPALNTWTHVAVTRSGTALKIFVNGIQTASTTSSYNFAQGAAYAGNDSSNAAPWYGYISNLRVVKGTAVYTSNFTPSTAPLTAISGTSWLVCQSNRFVDNSSNAFTITTSGAPTVQKFSPFLPNLPYESSRLGGAGYFDGTGDYLNLTTNSGLGIGTGTYTVECWVNASSAPGYASFLQIDTSGLQFGLDPSGYIAIAQQNVAFTVSSSTAVPLNTWNHVAASRDGSSVTRIFLNGVQIASATDTTNFATGTTAYINNNSGNSAKITGYITDVRVLKGTALYTSAFTPPTAPLTAITNTQLLLSNTNGAIFDNASISNLETIAGAQISTTQKKYGTASMYFDGTGDTLAIPSSVKPNFTFGTGDFTIEFWAWKSGNGSGGYDTVISFATSGNASGGFIVELSSSRGFGLVYDSTFPISSNFNPNDSTWHHYAVVRNGSTFALYKDGVQLTTATLTPTLGTNGNGFIGSAVDSTQLNFNGYIDDLRVTKGVARYLGAFTPPTSQLQDQ